MGDLKTGDPLCPKFEGVWGAPLTRPLNDAVFVGRDDLAEAVLRRHQLRDAEVLRAGGAFWGQGFFLALEVQTNGQE